MTRIVTVYSAALRPPRLQEMGFIRWYRMSAALAALGFQVDIASADLWRRAWRRPRHLAPNLRVVPITSVRWSDYDVVKTLFHAGFETLERHGGADHPFIIAKLGSVVGNEDRPGIYFYGRQREALFATQQRIARRARWVTLLSEPAVALWRADFPGTQTLLVPGAAETEIPAPVRNPYARDDRPACVFAGNYYGTGPRDQPEAHRTLADRLNELGRQLDARGARLHVVGEGRRRSLDTNVVTVHGPVAYDRSWDWLHFAAAGVVVAAGPFMHNNESTKIYYYLRAGLPVVSEAGFPNDHVVRSSRLGYVVENGRLDVMADRIVEATARSWDREAGKAFILANHTWMHRAAIYDRLIRQSPMT